MGYRFLSLFRFQQRCGDQPLTNLGLRSPKINSTPSACLHKTSRCVRETCAVGGFNPASIVSVFTFVSHSGWEFPSRSSNRWRSGCCGCAVSGCCASAHGDSTTVQPIHFPRICIDMLPPNRKARPFLDVVYLEWLGMILDDSWLGIFQI